MMLYHVVGYSSFDLGIKFLAQKQNYTSNNLWLTAFYIHVFSAVIALLAGLTQFNRQFLEENPKLHRFLVKFM